MARNGLVLGWKGGAQDVRPKCGNKRFGGEARPGTSRCTAVNLGEAEPGFP